MLEVAVMVPALVILSCESPKLPWPEMKLLVVRRARRFR